MEHVCLCTQRAGKFIFLRPCLLYTSYDDYDWSRSVPNLSGKLRRGSLRYQEAVELADVLDYDIVWVKRKR